jgi:hypothetical protein
MTPLVWLLIALVVIFLVIRTMSVEKFQPEFLDKTQVRQTVAVENSSYNQETNHVRPAPYSMGPIQGVPTVFQVNQYKAYIPA